MTDEAKQYWSAVAKWLSVVIAAIGMAGAVYAGLRTQLSDHAIRLAGLEAYRISHDYADELQQQAINYITGRVDALSSAPGARPDPYTGTEGRAVERRVDAVERRIEKLESNP